MTNRKRSLGDDGLGLIELIVAIVVSGIVMAAIVTIFFNSWKAQQDVLSVSEATNRGQLVGSAIEKAVRNAVDMQFDASTGVLKVQTSLAAECQGFFVGLNPETPADETPVTTVLTAASGGALTEPENWNVWDPALTLRASESSLARSGTKVSYVFVIETESAPVRIDGGATQRTITGSEDNPCW